MFIDADVYLEHFGKKGMKWGVRNDKKTTSDNSKRNKKVAIVLGSVATAAAIGAGAYFIKKRFGVSVSQTANSSKHAKKFAESIAKEPVSIIHASRGKSLGFRFLQHGGLTDSIHEYDAAGFADNANFSPNSMKRYGKNLEKIALHFNDPLGRKDFAGRVIPHYVIIPESLAQGITSHEQAVNKVWPMIKDSYNAVYEAARENPNK